MYGLKWGFEGWSIWRVPHLWSKNSLCSFSRTGDFARSWCPLVSTPWQTSFRRLIWFSGLEICWMSIAAKGFLMFPVISPLCQVWETPTAAPALSSVLYDSLDFRIRLFRIDVSSKYLPSGDAKRDGEVSWGHPLWKFMTDQPVVNPTPLHGFILGPELRSPF